MLGLVARATDVVVLVVHGDGRCRSGQCGGRLVVVLVVHARGGLVHARGGLFRHGRRGLLHGRRGLVLFLVLEGGGGHGDCGGRGIAEALGIVGVFGLVAVAADVAGHIVVFGGAIAASCSGECGHAESKH